VLPFEISKREGCPTVWEGSKFRDLGRRKGKLRPKEQTRNPAIRSQKRGLPTAQWGDARLADMRYVMQPYSLKFQDRDQSCNQNKKGHNNTRDPRQDLLPTVGHWLTAQVLVTPWLTQRPSSFRVP
jgi:hypothetical protein